MLPVQLIAPLLSALFLEHFGIQYPVITQFRQKVETGNRK